MAFWRRIKQSQIHTKLWSQFFTTRSYIPIRSPVTVTADPTRIWPLNSPRLPAGKLQLELPTNARFFAKKKVKSKPKPKPKVVEELRPRLNEEITGDVIRLVEGEGHTVMSRHAALELARKQDLDLVEVQRNSDPPVCKIKDFLKDKYKQQTKEKERAKEKSAVSLRQGACKEIRFSAKISQRDLEVRVDQAKRLMEQGYRVKFVAIGNSSSENGESSTKLLARFSPLMEECAVIESHNRVEDKDQIHVIMRHTKYGPLKKGSGKKAAVSNVKSGKETADTDGDEQENSDWTAAASASDDFDKVFDNTENPGNVPSMDRRGTLRPPRGSGREPSRPLPQFSNGPRQPQPQPHLPLNMNNRRSSAPDFGLFTPQENPPQPKQSGPVQVNRYKQTTGSESQRSSVPPSPHVGHGNRGIPNTRDGSGQFRSSHHR